MGFILLSKKRSARGAQAPRPSPATPPLALKESLSLGVLVGEVHLCGDNLLVRCTGAGGRWCEMESFLLNGSLVQAF